MTTKTTLTKVTTMLLGILFMLGCAWFWSTYSVTNGTVRTMLRLGIILPFVTFLLIWAVHAIDQWTKENWLEIAGKSEAGICGIIAVLIYCFTLLCITS